MPFLFVDSDPVDGVDRGAGERVGWGKADGDLHKLVIDGDAGGDLASGGGNFDDEGWFRCGLGGGPLADSIEFRGNYFGGYLRSLVSGGAMGLRHRVLE